MTLATIGRIIFLVGSPALLAPALSGAPARAEAPGPIGHWKFAGDANDASGRGHHGRAVAVDLTAPGPDGGPGTAARFDGTSSFVEIPPHPSLELGRGDFSLAVWAWTEQDPDDSPGDLLSKFDPATRRGLNWSIKSGTGVTSSQANDRNIHFGVDSGTEPAWTDRGRPGDATFVMALAVHDGTLYAGTCEAGPGAAGHVYRYDGERRWVDCGAPDRSNAVTSLASFGGKLHAGTGRYRLAGSALPESTNANPGGKVFRLEGDGRWADCGQLPGVEAVGGMVAFRGGLYASSLYKPAGLFRHRGGDAWDPCPLPDDGRRVVPLGVFNGHLYAGSYDTCSVARFDGKVWETFPPLEESGQTYSFEAHGGELFVGTWPNGRVFRFDRGERWVSAGRLGEETEAMGMAVHNGKLYAGTLPLAEVHRFDGGTSWTRTGRLDPTPDVRYRRAWSMAVFDGRLFCGTLPSGRVHALEVGQSATYDRTLEPGWRHLAAIREGARLSIFVDGRRVASSSSTANTAPLDLANRAPLRVGIGGHDHFRGRLSDLRLYDRALSADEVAALANRARP
ncbi:LamG-like jellyroll fold domain-containing protein [Tundrisphaera sp. TA3]|uniref:LamG-like jellyroll fold domain-containing protein n=1 Tax=Tundrisphaera sp. TA3 TaxID=3435775 RepID=UPI003EBCFB0F